MLHSTHELAAVPGVFRLFLSVCRAETDVHAMRVVQAVHVSLKQGGFGHGSTALIGLSGRGGWWAFNDWRAMPEAQAGVCSLSYFKSFMPNRSRAI